MTGGELRFDGRVALVTGAGGGLGKTYALLLASRGAAVVVNDLGGSAHGEGKSTRAADVVVEEIKAFGGRAVANYDSVEEGEKLVQTAIDAFGRIDIVINNAGILRDKSFARISDQDWDILHRVHLRGSFLVTRAAWPHFKKQGYGRIIMTASAAGIYGNFGQANYSAAKLGLYGLSNTLALEGKKSNIYCNTIAPVAGSRLTETVMPAELVNALKPDYVAPFVAYLCNEQCEENGSLFELGAGWYSKIRWERTKGVYIKNDGKVPTIENIRDRWNDITNFDGAVHPTLISDSMTIIMGHLDAMNTCGMSSMPTSGNTVDVNLALQNKFETETLSFSEKDVILYALGVGASPANQGEMKFLYEGADGFAVLPTFGVIPAQTALGQLMGGVPGMDFTLIDLLHGEQYLEVKGPIPTSGTLTSKPKFSAILDKGKGALLVLDVETTDQSGNPVFFNQFQLFIRGQGNFGGARDSPLVRGNDLKIPTRPYDAVEREKTLPLQAALYRLSGDSNPLHIDAQMAAMSGFKAPILHGLCSFGYAARHVLRHFAGNDTTLFRSIKVRFSKPVFPGETIQTEMWREANNIVFQCRVVERNEIVLSAASIELSRVVAATRSSGDVVALHTSGDGATELQAEAVFNEIKGRIEGRQDLIKKINAVFAWVITKDGKTAGQWVVDMKTNGSVTAGPLPAGVKADTTITVSDEDFVQLALGQLNAQKAFMTGKIKVKGNIMLAQKMESIFKAESGKVLSKL